MHFFKSFISALLLVSTNFLAQAAENDEWWREATDHQLTNHTVKDHERSNHTTLEHSKTNHTMVDHEHSNHTVSEHGKTNHTMNDHDHSNHTVKVHVVHVGRNSSLTFSPHSIKAKAGEYIQFQFHQVNHSVVQSSFSSPCSPINAVMKNVTGFDSGFMPVKANATKYPVFTVRVNNTDPIWAYCSQVEHCQKGMVFSVNAPSNGTTTFKTFKDRAIGAANSSSAAAAAASSSAAQESAATATTGAAATAAAARTADGAKSLIDMALLSLLAVSGAMFVGL